MPLLENRADNPDSIGASFADSRTQFGHLFAGHDESLGAQVLRVRSEVFLEAGVQLRSVLQERADCVDVEIVVGDLQQEPQVFDHRLADLRLQVRSAVRIAEFVEPLGDQVHHGEIRRDLVGTTGIPWTNLGRPAFAGMAMRLDARELLLGLVDVSRGIGSVESLFDGHATVFEQLLLARWTASGHEECEEEGEGGLDGLGHMCTAQEVQPWVNPLVSSESGNMIAHLQIMSISILIIVIHPKLDII